MEHGTAEAQFDALVAQLQEYDLLDKVSGLCFDTTATNTGRLSGTNVRFSRRQQRILLELACRRHVSELHIKHFAEHISTGKTLAPENQMFKMFQKEWSNLQDQIDLSKVTKFDVKAVKGTFLESQLLETIQFCKFVLTTEVFPRGDYVELLELTLTYLCPELSFRIRAPSSVSHARFMAKAIYYLKIQILRQQLTYKVSPVQQKEVSRMAEFVSIFYSVWFMRTALPAAAPHQDIKAFWQMKMYKKYIEQNHPEAEKVIDGVDGVLESMRRHTWYLDETLVPLALLDQDISAEDREAMAKRLYSLPVPETFKHSEEVDLFSELDFTCDNPPSLLPLIGKNSWFIFTLLNITKSEDKVWLTCPSAVWPFVEQFKTFSRFVDGIQVVNDCSERAVKLVSEFINVCHDEDDRQELLLAVQQRRDQLKVGKATASKTNMQAAYEAVLKQNRPS